MTAPARRPAALPPQPPSLPPHTGSLSPHHPWSAALSRQLGRHAPRRPDYWRQAAEIRQEWQEIGLSTDPADRSAAEEAIASIYARHRRARPEFHWVESPPAALPCLAGFPTHETLRSWVDTRRPPGHPPIASDIAAGLSRLRSELAEGFVEPATDRPLMKRPKNKPWPSLPPPEALDASLPFQELLRQGVRDALFRSLADGVYLPIRAALGPIPVGWYGHQDAAWVGHLDVLRRLGLVPGGQRASFDAWVTLARAGGWWWPGEHVCVLVERPAVIRVEPVPGSWHGEIRLRRDPGIPAVEYRDGWAI
ncbi:DUF6745 domain-containing protein [Actinoplanes sp. CA-142083]|uniref:DUF6745 domain-containing protein n=1 Tax=Actinoplanes sp. CA-142083 TaxID=3239903 RepID=UPI003D9440D2